MAKKWNEIRAQRDGEAGIEERRAEAQAALERELQEYASTLAGLRKARGFTQAQLAAALGVSQPQVARIEKGTNLFLSTLRSYVEAMGGRLELVASFEDGSARAVELGDFMPGETLEEVVAAFRGSTTALVAAGAAGAAGKAVLEGAGLRGSIVDVFQAGDSTIELVEVEGETRVTIKPDKG